MGGGVVAGPGREHHGELKYFYEGGHGHLCGQEPHHPGGQNPIEPGVLGKPMVVRAPHADFAEIAARFVQGGAAVQVTTPPNWEGCSTVCSPTGPRDEMDTTRRAS